MKWSMTSPRPIGEVLHLSAWSLESGHLHAAIVVEMDV
jgi:hypothetical protein